MLLCFIHGHQFIIHPLKNKGGYVCMDKVRNKIILRLLCYFFFCRKTPVHKFYSASGLTKFFSPVSPTKGPPTLPPLPQGFHHLYTHIEYGCTSPYYHHTGSTRRTCLKTGKWSGRHVSCSPGEGVGNNLKHK